MTTILSQTVANHSRAPYLLLPDSVRRDKQKERTKERQRKRTSSRRARPALLSFTVLIPLAALPFPLIPEEPKKSSFPPACPSARSTRPRSLLGHRTWPAQTGPPVLSSHTASRITRAWPAHAGHLAIRWKRLCCWPVSHHQYLSESILS